MTEMQLDNFLYAYDYAAMQVCLLGPVLNLNNSVTWSIQLVNSLSVRDLGSIYSIVDARP